ncbi:MAG: DUF1837 domain-containing protein [Shewanella oneidensis]|uniref:HamA C-terminal domain-containing protein n=1 Tax=Shewanella xiamenensis TaxID=332186 RepID=UPI000DB8078D|nr:DUF1837 domain-containing protein [Shewanella xiamenensis]PZP35527.1 MAG: DUF1837 domain-containing protein [Shewanella oneidensis]UML93176.1 DUF1837 domain-containing protein [Shewanella xiamenensis]
MQLSIRDFDFLNSFDHLGEYYLDVHKKNKINLFSLKISANEFDYKFLQENLLDPLIDFSLSRAVKAEFKDKPGTLSKKAREKFIDYIRNKGELGELILYSFLETHLKAPKILSKLELKTSTSHYVNGADGVHFLKLENGNYQLIFGESKTEIGITKGITDAFKSIYEFKNEINTNGQKKSGLPYEKSLISDHLGNETFSEDEKRLIKSIIYPSRDSDFDVDDAFGIFIGYEITISDADKKLSNSDFREKIKNDIKNEVKNKFDHITKKIEEHKLYGHNFYIYILPITELNDTRMKIQKGITE